MIEERRRKRRTVVHVGRVGMRLGWEEKDDVDEHHEEYSYHSYRQTLKKRKDIEVSKERAGRRGKKKGDNKDLPNYLSRKAPVQMYSTS